MQCPEKLVWTAIILHCLLQNSEAVPRIDALVETKVGLIRGLQAADGNYAMFKGIPYAQVEENNPFGPSVPFPKFDGAFEAYDDAARCPQFDIGTGAAIGSLDCLHLNVYVPNIANSGNRLPVLVWIYGGGFNVGHFGSNMYGPSYLVRHDVILVTINYRVGAYGFMCLDTPSVSGNQGLKDQELALKWVKDNIEAFGGNANEITIFGESAGGVSVDLQLLYAKEELFNKVILQSGTASCLWAVEELDRAIPVKLAQHLGYESYDIEDALSFLATVDPSMVVAASNELDYEYRPCVEKDFEGVEKFIDEHPLNIALSSTRINKIPILIGHNDKESLSILNSEVESIQNIFNDNLVAYFNFEQDELSEMEQNIRHFFIGDEKISEATITSIVDFVSDFTFAYPSVRSINRYVENGAESVFYYVFSYVGGVNFGHNFGQNFEQNLYNITVDGAAHGQELGYLFPQNGYLTAEDQLMVDQITTLWTNFAKTGNPTPEVSELLPVTWTPVSTDSMTCLNIGSEISIQQRPFNDRMAFWDLFFKINKEAQKGYREI